jgi:hypothetical protein
MFHVKHFSSRGTRLLRRNAALVALQQFPIFNLLGEGRFEKMTDISHRSLENDRTNPIWKFIVSLFATWSAARACAAAVESHRRPADEDLRQLGIDPKAFASVRLI